MLLELPTDVVHCICLFVESRQQILHLLHAVFGTDATAHEQVLKLVCAYRYSNSIFDIHRQMSYKELFLSFPFPICSQPYSIALEHGTNGWSTSFVPYPSHCSSSIIQLIDLDDTSIAPQVANVLLGIRNAFPLQNPLQDKPCILLYNLPLQYFPFVKTTLYGYSSDDYLRKTNKEKQFILFMVTYGFAKQSKQIQKSLLSFIMSLNSCIFICKNSDQKDALDWCRKLDCIIDPIPNIQPFDGVENGKILNIISLKTIPSVTVPSFSAYDAMEEISNSYENLNSKFGIVDAPFLSLCCNMFGKMNASQLSQPLHYATENFFDHLDRRDLWSMLHHHISPTSLFSWPYSSWDSMKPTLNVIFSLQHFVVNQLNQTRKDYNWQSIHKKFMIYILIIAVKQGVKMFEKSARTEIQLSLLQYHRSCLEVNELLELCMLHQEAAIRMFNATISGALLQEQLIQSVFESLFIDQMSNAFRELILGNYQQSEAYCQRIVLECFSKTKISDKVEELEEMLHLSLAKYLQCAKGPKKFQVLSFYVYNWLSQLLRETTAPLQQQVIQQFIMHCENICTAGIEALNHENQKLQEEQSQKQRVAIKEVTLQRMKENLERRKQRLDYLIHRIDMDSLLEYKYSKLVKNQQIVDEQLRNLKLQRKLWIEEAQNELDQMLKNNTTVR